MRTAFATVTIKLMTEYRATLQSTFASMPESVSPLVTFPVSIKIALKNSNIIALYHFDAHEFY